MKLYYYYRLIIIIFISIFINIINSQTTTLLQDDYNCMVNIMTSFSTIESPKNATGYYDFKSSASKVIVIITNYQVSQLTITQTSLLTSIDPALFSCLPQLTYINLKDSKLDMAPLISSSSLPPKLSRMSIDLQAGYSLTFTKLNSILKNIVITMSSQLTDTIINFSMINSTSWFNIGKSSMTSNQFSNSNFKLSFNNDLDGSKIWSPTSLVIYSNNFPSFKYIKSAATIYLNDGFDSNSLNDNIASHQNLSRLVIYGPNNNVQFPINIENINSTIFSSFTLQMSFSTPTKIYDISKVSNLQYIYFSQLGTSFHYNGLVPFIFSKKIFNLYYKDAYIESFDLDYWMSNYPGLSYLSLNNNSMTGTLLKFNNSWPLVSLDISNNNISGTIDESFCKVSLWVTNNKLTGELPSCITCFLPSIYYYFSGNNFTNYDSPPPCKTIVPNLIRIDNDSSTWKFYIFGKDLGILVPPRIRSDPDYPNFSPMQVTLLIPSQLISFDVDKTYEPPRIMTLYYDSSDLDYLGNFTLTWDPWVPLVDTVDWNGDELIFIGSDFTYNTTLIDIDIDGVKCIITYASFYQMNCTLQSTINSNMDHITIVTIGELYTQISLIKDQFNIIQNCTSDCSYLVGNGYCKSSSGLCSCNLGWQGEDCSLPFKRCPMDADSVVCFGNGACNNQTGVCTCFDLNSDPISCSQIECDDPQCNGQGICNKSTGKCECLANDSIYSWFGDSCEIPMIFVSSIEPSTILGGNSTFNGWFSDIHYNLSISIGGKPCYPIYSISNQSIICNAPPGIGKQVISIKQNSFEWTSNIIFYVYKELSYKCPNNCSTHGICNLENGFCNCFGSWGGPDCNSIKNVGSNNSNNSSENQDSNEPIIVLPPNENYVNDSTGSSSISNQKTSFQIEIYSLIEVDIYGNQVANYSLQKDWIKINESTISIHKLKQTIQNEQCTIQYIIEEVQVDREFSFAGINFIVDGGSIKMSIEILNYQYQNSLNTLKLLIKSSVKTIKLNNNNNCNDQQSQITTLGSDNASLNYITIQKDSKILMGRYLNHLISDGKSTFMSTTIESQTNDTIIVAMNLPHFVYSLSLDPDFSLLISSQFKSSCPSDNKPWLIPVAVTVPVVLVAVIVGVSIYLHRKFRIERPFAKKMKALSKLN